MQDKGGSLLPVPVCLCSCDPLASSLVLAQWSGLPWSGRAEPPQLGVSGGGREPVDSNPGGGGGVGRPEALGRISLSGWHQGESDNCSQIHKSLLQNGLAG